MEIALVERASEAVRKRGVRRELAQNMDVTPTPLEGAGVAPPGSLQGRSLWPLVAGSEYRGRNAIFVEGNFGGPPRDYSPVRAARSELHKLIRNYGPRRYGCYALEEVTPVMTFENRMARQFFGRG